eukprot:CAMPEP_0185615854 /NCGR_PEP_ID=MMETSP0436-20130131/37465_1 /TAXON_ID=626734 ORGANISM="Favella taraikaensis, Strain Fe Narragansett Bay" /NCGR_SAMPLE_ID=MMETSP0436 /ASSEMBLY_ACC=CAM_ASM_000390 /LENGTH=231 /DNA_ID=CAMNT_0028252033 /DNA_START=227 /DNA_END=920 /DNA_ORIENTATION=+
MASPHGFTSTALPCSDDGTSTTAAAATAAAAAIQSTSYSLCFFESVLKLEDVAGEAATAVDTFCAIFLGPVPPKRASGGDDATGRANLQLGASKPTSSTSAMKIEIPNRAAQLIDDGMDGGLMGSSAGDGRMGYQIGLVVLFLGDRFAQAGHRLRLGRCCLKRSLQFAGWLLAHRVDKCAFSLRTFYCVVVGLRRGAHRRLFLATARCARAAAWHHLELAVHELGRADLDW